MKQFMSKEVSKKNFLKYIAMGFAVFLFGGLSSVFSSTKVDRNYNRGGYGGKFK